MPEETITTEKKIVASEPYMNGAHNLFVRTYFYINSGLNILNSFRNLFLGIFAGYIALKLENPIWMVVVFLVALVVLTLVGWYQTHKMQKIFEWIGLRFSSYYGIKQFNYSEGTYNLLVDIKKLLEDRGK